MSLIAELKRRNVFKVGIAYAVGAWLLLQFTDVLSQLLSLPTTFGPVVVAVVAIGFPVVLFLAWAYELTPEGVKRESEVDRSQSITPQTGRKLNTAIFLMMALAIVYLLFDKFSDGADPGSASNQTAEVSQTGAVSGAPSPPSDAVPNRSVAVLPFENRSRLEDDAFFVEGIHDDLLTSLARIGSLKVISRTSVNLYRDSEKSIPEIAAELGVATVMEGAVQRAGDMVRINVQLIDARTDEHLWAEIFDRELTTQNLFAIQSEISRAIAQALEATLSPSEERRLEDTPTESLAAYNAFLRGRQYMARRSSEDLETARREFERAVEFDPGFALAWVGLADTNHLLTQYSTLDPADLIARQEVAVEKALAIDDQLGEAHIALASVRDDQGQLVEADAAFRRGIELSPNYVSGPQWYGGFLSNAVDRLDEAVRQLDKAVELDPLSSIVQANRYDVLVRQGDFERADLQLQQLQRTDPDFVPTLLRLGGWPLARRMALDEAVPHLRKANELDPGNPLYLWLEGEAYVSLGDLEAATGVQRLLEDNNPDHWSTGAIAVSLAVRTNNLAGALESASWVQSRRGRSGFQDTLVKLAMLQEDYQRARTLLADAWPGWQDRSQWAQWLPRNTGLACEAGWILMRTDDPTLGRALLEQARDFMLDTAPRHMQHPERLPVSVCLAALGDKDGALEQLEATLSFDYSFYSWQAGLGPMYDEMRDEPRFQAVMAELESRREAQRASLDRMRREGLL